MRRPMRKVDVEHWILSIADRVRAGLRNEDSRVELKRELTPAGKAARQIAALANAARGEPALWIIGLDEIDGVIGCTPGDLAAWWPQVTSQFESLAPELIDLTVPMGSVTLLGLLFGTERVPYVVKNPRFGTTDGGPVEFEVPWREGTATRSARRGDLIRILVPVSRAPHVEPLDLRLVAYWGQWEKDQRRIEATIDIYMASISDRTVVLPFHRCQVTIDVPPDVKDLGGAISVYQLEGEGRLSPQVSYSQLVMPPGGAGAIKLRALASIPLDARLGREARVRVALSPIGTAPVVVDLDADEGPDVTTGPTEKIYRLRERDVTDLAR